MKKEIYKTKDEILQFFEAQGLTYLQRTRVDWRPLFSQDFHKRSYFLDNREEFESIHSRYASLIKKKVMAPVYIKRVDEKVGYGVFAEKAIEKDAFIGEYTGVVQEHDEDEPEGDKEHGYPTDYSWYYLDDTKDGTVIEINGLREGNEMRFVNHSDTPNLDVEHVLIDRQWIIFFKANRNIKKDEQLFITYGEAYWEDGFRDLSDI